MSTPQAAGPPCDICGAEESIMSVMSLADYSQMKLGPGCAPGFFRQVADDMEGAGESAASEYPGVSGAGVPEIPGQLELSTDETGHLPSGPVPEAPEPVKPARAGKGGAKP